LTNDAARDRGVTWSPDGKTLYFFSNRSGTYRIWRIFADGSGLAPVADDNDYRRLGVENVVAPDVSPDGRTLAAASDRFPFLIHLDRPMGQRAEVLADGEAMSGVYPKWSPDGKRFIGVSKTVGFGVYSPQTHRFENVSDGMWPLWLPDARHIVSFDSENIRIFDLDTRQTAFRPLPPELRRVDTWTLSRDGSTLFGRQVFQQGDVWLMQMEKK
jgi:Tol biopolymer transport system component